MSITSSTPNKHTTLIQLANSSKTFHQAPSGTVNPPDRIPNAPCCFERAECVKYREVYGSVHSGTVLDEEQWCPPYQMNPISCTPVQYDPPHHHPPFPPTPSPSSLATHPLFGPNQHGSPTQNPFTTARGHTYRPGRPLHALERVAGGGAPGQPPRQRALHRLLIQRPGRRAGGAGRSAATGAGAPGARCAAGASSAAARRGWKGAGDFGQRRQPGASRTFWHSGPADVDCRPA